MFRFDHAKAKECFAGIELQFFASTRMYIQSFLSKKRRYLSEKDVCNKRLHIYSSAPTLQSPTPTSESATLK
jgi:hypothetical protein